MNFTNLFLPKHIKKSIEDGINDNTVEKLPVCTRLPPEPSGDGLHLGHLFAGRLNQSVATMYNGKFLVRFDDTNPSSECEQYEKSILKDLIDCGFDLTNLSYTSDSFQLLIDTATKLISLGHAYIDSCSQEQISEQRKTFSESPNRNNDIDDNMSKWTDMIAGKNTTMCMRLKAIPNSKNGAMRDPILYRYIDAKHHRTGDKFKVYPTYDFACPILDSYDGVTHIFRSKEYVERDEQMKFILNKLNMRVPKAITYGRLSIENSILSKRKIAEGIQNGVYSGWDDKKLFTYKGMRNRGISLEGINNFLDSIGFPETNVTIQQQKLFTINMKTIDKQAIRLIGIDVNDTMEISIINHTNLIKTIPNFIGNKTLGEREITMSNKLLISKKEHSEFQDGEEITIIHFGNAIYNSPDILILHKDGDPKTTSKKILWLNDDNYENIEVEMLNGEYKEFLVDPYINKLKHGACVQLNKYGYYYVKRCGLKTIELVEIES